MDPMQPTLQDILTAEKNVASSCLRTPLVPFYGDSNKDSRIFLKLETLQPTGSFKHRGSCNAIRSLSSDELKDGVCTSSAGNFGQGLADNARTLNVPCTVIVPDSAPQTKLDGLTKYGADICKVTFDEWWNVMMTKRLSGISGRFIHPVCEKSVIAGNATVGLEILQDLPDVTTVVAPFGGGGLTCGIAAALAAKGRSDVKVYACEVDVAAPLAASLEAGKPAQVANYEKTFVDGMGGKALLPDMWPMASSLLAGTFTVSLPEIVGAMRDLARAGLVTEGAGAAPLVPARDGRAGAGNIVCVLSGRNIDSKKLTTALHGDIPKP